MNVTLRKASALQNSINETIKSIEFKTEIRLNEFQDSEVEIGIAEATVHGNIQRRENLLASLYEIRKAVSKANAQSGIDEHLADVAHLDKQIQFYNDLSKKEVRVAGAVLQGKLEKIKSLKDEARSRIYGYGDELTTSVFAQDRIDQFRKNLAEFKKAKQKVQDKILELNVKTEITVGDNVEEILKKEGLV